MTWPAFMTIIGQEQGPVTGSCELPGLEGDIEVYAFSHEVEIPRSHETGLPTGRRVHHDVTVNKEIDKSTPKLYKALCDGEKLTEVSISWYWFKGKSLEKFYSVKLINAIISRIKPCSPHRRDMAHSVHTFMEDVSFAYEKIIWTWELQNVIHEDSWISPKG
jgi:type VI secretion system secreted protein Hcp